MKSQLIELYWDVLFKTIKLFKNIYQKEAYLKKLAIGCHSGGSTCATTWRLESPTAFYTSTTKLQKTFDSKEKIYFAKVAINFLVDQKKL
ncbi:hypothetical protein BpHYR1_052578 [Brachionus plicatilis]|uniref:Uncharacterized protein n=1 Tax=Brachionus plicatilis TaxID=10195 RepID=A0A3M7PF04_BRAPC|nr:hypothetical protein BpHYR1_052578 [Brachionus plicatilis]